MKHCYIWFLYERCDYQIFNLYLYLFIFRDQSTIFLNRIINSILIEFFSYVIFGKTYSVKKKQKQIVFLALFANSLRRRMKRCVEMRGFVKKGWLGRVKEHRMGMTLNTRWRPRSLSLGVGAKGWHARAPLRHHWDPPPRWINSPGITTARSTFSHRRTYRLMFWQRPVECTPFKGLHVAARFEQKIRRKYSKRLPLLYQLLRGVCY